MSSRTEDCEDEAVAKLIYSALMSLDGYVADEDGNFDWAEPDAEVHAFINELERPVGVYIYGRRMYETMVFWETALAQPDLPPPQREFAQIWQAAEKVVYSKTLPEVSTVRTRLERDFDPAQVRMLKETAPTNIAIGGPTIAARAIAAGMVDELHLFLVPCIIGGGLRALPDDARLDLELLDQHRFGNGTVYLRYRRI